VIEVAVLLLVPLALRYLAAGRMRRLRAQLIREDEEYRQLRGRYERVADALGQARHNLRYYEVRRERLNADLHSARRQLVDLRSAPTGRRAA